MQTTDPDRRFHKGVSLTTGGIVVHRKGVPPLTVTVQEHDIKELRMVKRDLPDAEYACFSNDECKKKIEGVDVYPWREGLKQLFDIV